MELSLVGLLMMVITLLSSVNGQTSSAIGQCLVNGVNDISRVDPFCGSRLRILINSEEFFNLPQSTLNEVCSTSCWNRFSPVVRRCFNADADNAEVGFRLACGTQLDGDNCAQVFSNLRNNMNNDGVCVITTPGRCPAGCTNFLMDRMRQLGCCFGESLYLLSMFSSTRQVFVDAMETYRTCNLPLPQPCQNFSIEATAPPTRNNSGAAGGWAINGIMMAVMLTMSLMV